MREHLVWLYYNACRNSDKNPLFEDRLRTVLSILHLCTFKTPMKGAVMSEQGDADCSFSMCNGVQESTDESRHRTYIDLFYRLMAYIRYEKGERDVTYMMIRVWYDYFPKLTLYFVRRLVICDNYNCIGSDSKPYGSDSKPYGSDSKPYGSPYGNWNDMKYLCEYIRRTSELAEDHPLINACVELINNQVELDPTIQQWIPREGKRFSWLYELLVIQWANKHYPYLLKTKINLIGAMNKCKRMYRTQILAKDTPPNKTYHTLSKGTSSGSKHIIPILDIHYLDDDTLIQIACQVAINSQYGKRILLVGSPTPIWIQLDAFSDVSSMIQYIKSMASGLPYNSVPCWISAIQFIYNAMLETKMSYHHICNTTLLLLSNNGFPEKLSSCMSFQNGKIPTIVFYCNTYVMELPCTIDESHMIVLSGSPNKVIHYLNKINTHTSYEFIVEMLLCSNYQSPPTV